MLELAVTELIVIEFIILLLLQLSLVEKLNIDFLNNSPNDGILRQTNISEALLYLGIFKSLLTHSLLN